MRESGFVYIYWGGYIYIQIREAVGNGGTPEGLLMATRERFAEEIYLLHWRENVISEGVYE